MKRPNLQKMTVILLIVLVSAIAIIELAWLIAVPPASDLAGLAARSLEHSTGVAFDFTGARKTLLPGFSAEAVEMEVSGRRFTPVSPVTVRLQPLRLFSGASSFRLCGKIGGGPFSGTAGVRGKTPFLELDLREASVTPFLEAYGLTGQGHLQIEGGFSGGTGEFRIDIPDLQIAPEGLLSFVPVDRFRSLNGLIRFSNKGLEIPGIEVRGEGLHARIEGNIRSDGKLDLDLHVFPDADFVRDNSLLLTGMNKYRESPDHYRVPIRGTMARPVVR